MLSHLNKYPLSPEKACLHRRLVDASHPQAFQGPYPECERSELPQRELPEVRGQMMDLEVRGRHLPSTVALHGQRQPVVLTEMVHVVQRLMEGASPELRGPSFAHVPQVVHAEEVRFARTLDTALEKLEDDLRPLTAHVGTPFQENAGTYSGERAFQLYDTYGLPLDFILDSAHDLGIPFDHVGFDRAMQEQRM